MGFQCNIAITSVQDEGEITMRQIVQKRLEYVRYGQFVPKEDIPLEYIAYDPISVDNTLFIADLSGETPENSQVATYSFNQVTVYTGQNFALQTKNTLITSKYVVFEDGTKYPLFYAHKLPADTVNVSIQKVTNLGRAIIPSGTYEFDEDAGYVFGSFENFFDEESGRYTLYYVESVDSNGDVTVGLWNGEPAFHEATFDDIDPNTGWLFEDGNAYIVNPSGNNWHFSLPKVDTYFVKGYEDTVIKVLDPTLQTAADPWFVDVTVGNFTANINGTDYNYSVPEFDLQNFFPTKPYLFAAWETALKISKEAVKLQRESSAIYPDDFLHLDLIVFDKDGDEVYALTTDSSKHDNYYSDTDIKWNSTIIDSWDNVMGVISLGEFNVLDSYTLKASYYYAAKTYTMTEYNLNPLFNEDILNFMFVVYIVPNVPAGDHALYYLLVKDNIIWYCSQTGNPVPNLSQYNSDGTPNPDSVVGWEYEGTGASGSTAFRDVYPQYLVLAEITGLVPDRPEGGVDTIAISS